MSGPVAILAGAGTGKTRVISHRVAYAVASGAVDPRRVLVVTFTDKAAKEMRARLAALGLGEIAASTFHAAARSQLVHFWPLHHDGEPLPRLLESKIPLVIPLARALPGNYRFTTAKDLADEIEWAKNRRVAPLAYEAAAAAASRTPPVPADLFIRVYRGYEDAKRRRGVLDFEDLLTHAVDLYEADDSARAVVRRRYAWFSVDEYQDTNPLQQGLLEAWLGDRRDLCVVGDEDQTIYSFTGATEQYLTGFRDRYPDAHVFSLVTNYRSTPQVLATANRLIAATGRSKELRAVAGDGPEPSVVSYFSADAELAGVVALVKSHKAEGVPADEIAVLVRTNASLAPVESALTQARIPFSVRGARFFARPDVRAALQALRAAPPTDAPLVQRVTRVFERELGFTPDAEPPGAEDRERHSALLTLVAIARELAGTHPGAGVAELLAEIGRRDSEEASAAGGGVVLSTLHRAKGLEWDVVFLPMLEDGILPIRQSLETPAALAEERRLLYVGITRARRHLHLSWVVERDAGRGPRRSRPSRFLSDLRVARSPVVPAPQRMDVPRGRPGERVRHARHGEGVVIRANEGNVTVQFDSGQVGNVRGADVTVLSSAAAAEPGVGPAGNEDLLEALRAWRLERSRADGVPAYVVADNKTLEAISIAEPRTASELLLISGIGPSKIERYGAEILDLVIRTPS